MSLFGSSAPFTPRSVPLATGDRAGEKLARGGGEATAAEPARTAEGGGEKRKPHPLDRFQLTPEKEKQLLEAMARMEAEEKRADKQRLRRSELSDFRALDAVADPPAEQTSSYVVANPAVEPSRGSHRTDSTKAGPPSSTGSSRPPHTSPPSTSTNRVPSSSSAITSFSSTSSTSASAAPPLALADKSIVASPPRSGLPSSRPPVVTQKIPSSPEEGDYPPREEGERPDDWDEIEAGRAAERLRRKAREAETRRVGSVGVEEQRDLRAMEKRDARRAEREQERGRIEVRDGYEEPSSRREGTEREMDSSTDEPLPSARRTLVSSMSPPPARSLYPIPGNSSRASTHLSIDGVFYPVMVNDRLDTDGEQDWSVLTRKIPSAGRRRDRFRAPIQVEGTWGRTILSPIRACVFTFPVLRCELADFSLSQRNGTLSLEHRLSSILYPLHCLLPHYCPLRRPVSSLDPSRRRTRQISPRDSGLRSRRRLTEISISGTSEAASGARVLTASRHRRRPLSANLHAAKPADRQRAREARLSSPSSQPRLGHE